MTDSVIKIDEVDLAIAQRHLVYAEEAKADWQKLIFLKSKWAQGDPKLERHFEAIVDYVHGCRENMIGILGVQFIRLLKEKKLT